MGAWGELDWQRAWLAPYRSLGEATAARLAAGDSVADALNACIPGVPPMLSAGPLRFVAHEALPTGEAYEAFIHRTANVPTRDNLHDFFNGLVWLRFPLLKRRLNELQAQEISQSGIGATRGAVRDALTLFDENAAFWQGPPQLAHALQGRDWHALFVTHRLAWADARLVLFGHALLEKLVQPRKSITAHACVVPSQVDDEAHLCAMLNPAWLASKSFHPLQVLGVPGWWAANGSAAFYEDPSVFRAPRPPPA
jgi:hypothetical protein